MEQGLPFIIGEWTVHPTTGVLSRNGHKRRAEPKLMDVLLVLVEHQGEVVSRDQLLAEAWQGLVVTDEVLTRCISELRTLLDDTAREKHYIRTVPKRGYSLIAAVSPLEAEQHEPAVAPSIENTDGLKPEISKQGAPAARVPGTPVASVMPWPVQLLKEFLFLLRSMISGVVKISLFAFGTVLLIVAMALTFSGLKNITSEDKDRESISISIGDDLELNSVEDIRAIAQVIMDEIKEKADQEPDEQLTEAPRFSSIAVLPFADLSPEPDKTYLTDGLSEDIINALVQVPDLKVTSRTSSFSFREQSLDIREIGSRLGVETLLEGTIRVDGERLRVTARLTNADDGYPVWSASYDRMVDDVFAIQQEITSAIARELSPANSIRAMAGPASYEAYEYYLLGRDHWQKRTRESLEKAANYFNRALELDDKYALAWSGLSDTRVLQVNYQFEPREPMLEEAGRYSAEALRLAPALAEAHASRAIYFAETGSPDQAIAEYRKAIDLKPGYSMAHMWLGSALMANGKAKQAAEAYGQARDLDPMHPQIRENYLRGLLATGQLDEARSRSEEYAADGDYFALKPLEVDIVSGHYDRMLSRLSRTQLNDRDRTKGGKLAMYALIMLGKLEQAKAVQISVQERMPEKDAVWYEMILALIERDGARLEVLAGEYNSKDSYKHCQGTMAAVFLGKARWLQGKWQASYDTFLTADAQSPEPCLMEPEERIFANLYQAEALKKLGDNALASVHLGYARSNTEKAWAQGWRHPEFLSAAFAAELLSGNREKARGYLEQMLDNGVQPWGFFRVLPFLDDYSGSGLLAEYSDRLKIPFKAQQSRSRNISLGRLSL